MEFFKKFLYTCFFISFLCSMNVWFSWNKASRYINVALAIFIVISIVAGKIKLELNARNVISFLLLAFAFFTYNFSFTNFNALIHLACALITFWVIISLNTQDKSDCLNFITKWFTILMVPSLLLWLLNWFVPLPSFGTVKIDNEFQYYLPYENHILFLKASIWSYGFRFTGPFLEPGHLGMMSAFLLYANKFNFKDKRLICILVVLLFTLSLAGYMLAIIGYCFNKIVYDRKFMIRFVCVVVVLIPILSFSTSYKGGHNFLNEMIIQRLQYDEEVGFTGNNRVFGEIDEYYDFLLSSSQYFWTGFDEKTIKWLAEERDSRGTGFVMFVVRYGFLGLIIVSLFYIFYAASAKRKKYALVYLLFVCFVFWQRSYPFWTSWLICYVWGISTYDSLNYKPGDISRDDSNRLGGRKRRYTPDDIVKLRRQIMKGKIKRR